MSEGRNRSWSPQRRAGQALRSARLSDERQRRIAAMKRRELEGRAHLWLELPRATYDAIVAAAAERGLTPEEMAAAFLNIIAMDHLEAALLCDAEAA